MALYEIGEPVVEPVSLSEAKNYLRLSPDFYDDDLIIKSLITGVRIEAESRTGGRVFPVRQWEWEPDESMVASCTYEIPISPVTSVEVYDGETKLEEDSYVFTKSSLAPYGRPLYAKIVPAVDVENPRIVVTVGWPNETKTQNVVSTDPPLFMPDYTTYTENTITLQFNRKVVGEATPKSFTILIDGEFCEVYSVAVEEGRVKITMSEDMNEGSHIVMTYVSGFLRDEDDNYVMPLMKINLPDIDFSLESVDIPEVATEEVVLSTVPKVVKSWMLIRIATLYQQRSEIAIQAGKTSNSFFPRDFIGGLLDAYTVEKA